MSWIEIVVIVLTSLYLLFMLALYIYKRAHHEAVNACYDAKGPRLVEQYHKAKRKEARMQRKGAKNAE